jgi:protein-tyrosine kinase
MSRIHDALAKAVRERERTGSTEISQTFLDIASQVNGAAISSVESFETYTPEKRGAPSNEVESLLKRCGHYDWKLDPRMNVFLSESKDTMGAERFRTLRSRLYQIADNQKLGRILVTSSLPAEGKSFVCANLAQAIAQQAQRSVLLIDADMRKPAQHKIFGTTKAPGLSNYLRGEVDEYGAIQNGRQNNLFLIPSGDEISNPGELVLNEQMKKLVAFGTDMFDWVIIDSPPALAVHDASLLADLCDGVLFVVRAASTDFEIAMKASTHFRKRNLVGVVFNGVDRGECSYGNYYYS